MRWQDLALLVLRSVGLWVGQNQMCRLRAGIEFQNILCGGEKNKTQKGRQ